MKTLRAIYDRIPTLALVLALLVIFVSAWVADRSDATRYRLDFCKRHGWACRAAE